MINQWNYQIIMTTQYNRHQGKIFPLSERGFRQAQRNNSHQIWTLLSWTETEASQPKQLDETLQTRLKQSPIVEADQTINDETKKSVGFKLSKNDQGTDNKNEDGNTTKAQNTQSFDRKKAKSILISNKKEENTTKVVSNQETQLQKIKRKSIQKYIKEQVPFTRTLSNSAFRKFYQRPCPQAYGSRNIKSGGVCYGDFMKTHNIQPHTLDNKPEHYQTYTSALNFGKRTKLDLEDRWKRIERQLAKNLDYRQLAKMQAFGEVQVSEENKEAILKENINRVGEKNGTAYPQFARTTLTKTSKSLQKMTTKGTLRPNNMDQSFQQDSQSRRRAKSSQKPLYFIYKYKQQSKDGYSCTRYARDRHGLTCYVDDCFRQNDEALLNFQKKIKPIYAEKCRPEDVNIDAIRIKNHQQSKQHSFPRHYLTPCVEVPYVSGNYSRKKSQSICETTA